MISNSLEELEDIKRNLYRLAEALGIAMSDKKNIITPFRHHSFTFLKMRVTLTETGKVVMKLSRKSIRAMRRKMDIFRRWMDEGRMGPGGRVPVLSIVESAREAVPTATTRCAPWTSASRGCSLRNWPGGGSRSRAR